jgi:Ni/Co efflux regulator RcnB
MRKVLLAGLAGLMIAGPVLADERRDDHGDRREWQGRGNDGGDQRQNYDRDRHDDRGGWQQNARYGDGHRDYDRRDNDRRDNDRYRDNDWRRGGDRGNDWHRGEDRGSDWRWSGARYRGPVYVYPRGYGYQAWGIGNRVPQAYFDNRYWIGDPGYYRLPLAYQGTRWIRIGADALLIDLRAGVVIRAVRGLYW